MEENPKNLEQRTAAFAEAVRRTVKALPHTVANVEDAKQLIRSSGSVAANCIEADEALSNRDRVMRFRICRKEAKESQLWLRLVFTGDSSQLQQQCTELREEADELMLIFTAIIKKLE